VSVVRIAEVEAIPLRIPSLDPASLDESSETIVVRIIDEHGVVGIGEADAPAAVVRALVLMDDVHAWSRGLCGMLLGRDPFEIGALYDALYAGTIFHGRRGLGIHALSRLTSRCTISSASSSPARSTSSSAGPGIRLSPRTRPSTSARSPGARSGR
jgi:L-alanine-DL-glutamate epimerase-like enolase superfamily enzyme